MSSYSRSFSFTKVLYPNTKPFTVDLQQMNVAEEQKKEAKEQLHCTDGFAMKFGRKSYTFRPCLQKSVGGRQARVLDKTTT